MAKPVAETPFLKFKFLRNTQIYLGTPQTFTIPSTMRAQPNPQAQRDTRLGRKQSEGEGSSMLVMPVFDMDFVHKIELKNERPMLPKKLDGMSDTYHSKLCDQAYERAAEGKIFNDGVRERVYSYVRNGVLEIVEDPFPTEEIPEGFDELTESLAADAAAETEREEAIQKKKPPKDAAIKE